MSRSRRSSRCPFSGSGSSDGSSSSNSRHGGGQDLFGDVIVAGVLAAPGSKLMSDRDDQVLLSKNRQLWRLPS